MLASTELSIKPCKFGHHLHDSICSSLAAVLVQYRMDCANSLLYGISVSNINKLQRLQNSSKNCSSQSSTFWNWTCQKCSLASGTIIWHWNFGQMEAERAKLCSLKYWKVVDWLSIGTNINYLPITSKICDLKSPPFNCGQAVAYGATLWTDRCYEVIEL